MLQRLQVPTLSGRYAMLDGAKESQQVTSHAIAEPQADILCSPGKFPPGSSNVETGCPISIAGTVCICSRVKS